MCPSYMVTREEKHTTRGRATLSDVLRLDNHRVTTLSEGNEAFMASGT